MRRALIAGVLIGAVLSNLAMARWYGALLAPTQRDTSAAGVLLDALGEVRTFLAQTLWFQIDIYHHQMQEQGIDWKDERDLMSMYRMVTTLDPRFVEAYDVASYQLVQNFRRTQEGLDYLDEGIRNNPDSAQLRFNKAFLLYFLKRYEEAATEAGAAMALYAPDPRALVHDMTSDEQIPFLNALRMFVHAEGKLGNRAPEVHGLRIWLMLRPNDPYPKQRLEALHELPEGYTPDSFLRTTLPR